MDPYREMLEEPRPHVVGGHFRKYAALLLAFAAFFVIIILAVSVITGTHASFACKHNERKVSGAGWKI